MIHSKDYVTNLDDDCIQPNAVDLRLKSLHRINTKDGCNLFNGVKSFRERVEVEPDDNGMLHLEAGIYDMLTQHEVKVPEGAAGWLIIRSTLARNGLLLGNGLYDAGYDGLVGGILHVPGPTAIEVGSRVAQFIMVQAETDRLYDGHYNTTRGESRA